MKKYSISRKLSKTINKSYQQWLCWPFLHYHLGLWEKLLAVSVHGLICTRIICRGIKVKYTFTLKVFFLPWHHSMLNDSDSSTFTWYIWYRARSFKWIGSKFKNSLSWSLNENLCYHLDSHVNSAQQRNMFNMPRFSNFWHAFTVVCIYFSKV